MRHFRATRSGFGAKAGSIEVNLRHGETVVTTNNAVHPAAEHILETEGFDRDDLPIVLAVFRIFRGILEEHGDELQLYKHLQFEKLPAIVSSLETGELAIETIICRGG
jgi:hypothetical protein